MLVLDNLSKSFSGIAALKNVSFSLPSSGYAVIVGESGGGKTTLLKAIAGHVSVDSGTIALNGTDLTGTPASRRPVTSVFQQFALFPHMTVAQNIGFGLEQQSVPGSRINERVGAMLDLVGLAGMENRKPGSLSGGQQQRVALARALAPEPAAVLLDEPLGSLDPALRTSVRKELARIQRESGVLFLHVSHDREEAWTLADHLLVMHQGELVAADSLEALHQYPGSARVAKVLGYDNVVPSPGDSSEHLAFAAERVELGTGTWQGLITSETALGPMVERELVLDSGAVILQREVAASSSPGVAVGSQVKVHVPADAIRVVRPD